MLRLRRSTMKFFENFTIFQDFMRLPPQIAQFAQKKDPTVKKMF